MDHDTVSLFLQHLEILDILCLKVVQLLKTCPDSPVFDLDVQCLAVFKHEHISYEQTPYYRFYTINVF